MRNIKIVETLRIRVPEQLYVASAGHTDKKSLVLRQPEIKLPNLAAQRGAAESPSPKPARNAAPRRRRLELPRLKSRSDSWQTVLQPQFSPDMKLPSATSLPEVFFWAPRTELPKYAKPFVEPGREMQPSRPRLLDAPPRLEIPSAEPSPLNVPATPDSQDALRLMKPAALPVRTSVPQSGIPETGVSADTMAGDPTNLLSLALNPQRMRELLSVPPGNQLGQLPEAGNTGSPTLSAASGNGGSGAKAASGSTPLKGIQIESARAEPTPQPAAPSPEESAASAESLRAAALAAAAPTRIEHPAGGVFDVVVQSGAADGFPESAGALAGKPIYSVYIRAGGGRDWLLQYCIPPEQDTVAEISGYVVRLTTGAPLLAPYPRVTMRPTVKSRAGRHVMVHAYITPQGRFRDIKVLSSSSSNEAEMVQAVLDQWVFRPASRDGKPLEVEILLAIPAE